MQFACEEVELEILETNGMFQSSGGFHGEKPSVQRSVEQSAAMIARPVHPSCTAEV
jgi:hypothetical protein